MMAIGLRSSVGAMRCVVQDQSREDEAPTPQLRATASRCIELRVIAFGLGLCINAARAVGIAIVVGVVGCRLDVLSWVRGSWRGRLFRSRSLLHLIHQGGRTVHA